jgi:hypothetical protein
MKKNVSILLIVALVLFISLIFINSVFADLYIVRDQEGKIIAITNQNTFKAEYQELGYTFGLWFKQTEMTPTLDSLVEDWESQIKEPLKEIPKTETEKPAPETKIDRDKMIEIFKANASAKWGDDYQMVKYEIKEQTEAYDWVIKYAEYSDILERAKQKWGNDYVMVKYEYEEQLKAYNWINQQKTYPEIMKKAKQKWGVDYVMVKYEYEQQVSAYEWLERNKDKNPEAFKRASNKWGNDYVMVKYEYEK